MKNDRQTSAHLQEVTTRPIVYKASYSQISGNGTGGTPIESGKKCGRNKQSHSTVMPQSIGELQVVIQLYK